MLSILNAGRTVGVGVGECGGERKTAKKENIVSLGQRGQPLKKKGVINHAHFSLHGYLPFCTRHPGSRQPPALRGRRGGQSCVSSSIIFNLLANFISAQQHFLPETKLEAAWVQFQLP